MPKRDTSCRSSLAKGGGAFRRFKEGIYRLGLLEAWNEYRDRALRRIAKEWCEEDNLEYLDDESC